MIPFLGEIMNEKEFNVKVFEGFTITVKASVKVLKAFLDLHLRLCKACPLNPRNCDKEPCDVETEMQKRFEDADARYGKLATPEITALMEYYQRKLALEVRLFALKISTAEKWNEITKQWIKDYSWLFTEEEEPQKQEMEKTEIPVD